MKLGICLQHHALMVCKKFQGSNTLWSKMIMKIIEILIVFIIIIISYAYCHETGLDRFLK